MAREINVKAELPIKISLTKFLNSNRPIDVSRLRNCQQSLSTHQRVNILKNVTKSGTTETALHKAAYEDQKAIVKCLLEGLTEIERLELLKIQDEYGNTALHKAASGGHADAVKCIMEILTPHQRKELYIIRNRNGETALAIAERQNKENVVEYLRSCEASDRSRQKSTTSAYASAEDIEGELIGKGGFGCVYLHTDRETNTVVAVKKVVLGPNLGNEVTKEVKALRNEIALMKELDHERIVKYIRSVKHSNSLCILMEYLSGGSIKDLLEKSGPLSEDGTKKFTRQILEGLCYLHGQGIMHRDVKGSNVLCDGEGNVKLADFGLSKRMLTIQALTSEANKNTNIVGTAHYMAPEVVVGGAYEKKADIWSTGATIVEMLTTHPPWHNLNQFQAMFQSGMGAKPVYIVDPPISTNAENFLALTFQRKEHRPRAEELLQHYWLET